MAHHTLTLDSPSADRITKGKPVLGTHALSPVHTVSIHAAVRIHKDGLMRGTFHARGLAPAKIFIGVDPLSYPIHSRLEIEFLPGTGTESRGYRLPATVTRRSPQGIELRLQAGQGD